MKPPALFSVPVPAAPALPAMAVAIIAALAGCVIETTDRADQGGDAATISARWSLRNMTDGAVTLCPPGIDTVQLFAQAIDDQGTPVADPSVDLFDCDRGAGTSDGLVPDVYQVWIELRSHDLATLYAQSLSQILDVRRADQKFSTDVLNDGGYFQLAWDLVGADSNRPIDCAQVTGLDAIVAISTSVADPHRAYDDRLRCEDHATITGGLLAGAYRVSIDARASGTSIGSAIRLTDQTISGQNRVTDLGHLLIPIDGL